LIDQFPQIFFVSLFNFLLGVKMWLVLFFSSYRIFDASLRHYFVGLLALGHIDFSFGVLALPSRPLLAKICVSGHRAGILVVFVL